MNGKTLPSDNKQIIATLLAGLSAIVAAYIRREKSGERTRAKTPVLSLLFPVFYFLLGTALAWAEPNGCAIWRES
jgi:hypothetical protein